MLDVTAGDGVASSTRGVRIEALKIHIVVFEVIHG